jgi:four helix bundle protein
MLRLYTDIILLITRLAPYLDRIEKHDRDLARQGRRASASIALNAREGDGCRGGTRRARHSDASGSAQELGAVLDVGEALRWILVDAETKDLLDKVQRTLSKLAKRRGDGGGGPRGSPPPALHRHPATRAP